MSGGGDKKSKTAVAPTPAVQPVLTQNFPAFMPGQQGLLADQLSAGGYGTPASNMGMLSGLYSNQTMPIINRPDQIAQYLTQQGLKPVAGGLLADTKSDGNAKSRKGTGYGGHH